MALAPVGERRYGYVWDVGAAGAVLIGALAAFVYAPDGVAETISNLGLFTIAAVATAGCLAASRAAEQAIKTTWILMACACGSWAFGQAVWSAYELVLDRAVPFPSVADIGYLGAIPLAIASFLRLLAITQPAAGRVRAVLDGLMIGAALLFASWVLVLESIVRANSANVFHSIIAIAYPVGDVVVVTLAIFLVARNSYTGALGGTVLALAATGWMAISVADSGFLYLTEVGKYASGSPVDLGWAGGFLLIFLASRHPRAAVMTDAPGPAAVARPIGWFVPYAAVVGAAALAVWELLERGRLDRFLAADMTLLVILLMFRQVLTVMENLSLTRDLEARVDERTRELQASQQRFEALVQNSSDIVTVVDRTGIVTYQSESVSSVLGYRPDDFVGREFAGLLESSSRAMFLQALENAAGQAGNMVHVDVTISNQFDGTCRMEITLNNLLDNESVRGIVLNSRDVSKQRQLEEELSHQALHDSLTSLANRALFKDRVEHALARRTSKVSVLFLDLDDFKHVNDSMGHVAGDKLLQEVAFRLQGCVRPEDTVARLGGDEFGILVVEDLRGRADTRVAEAVLDDLRRPFVLENREMVVRGSLGIATSDEGVDADQLLRNADLAMYRAKARKEGRFERYNREMHTQLVERLRLEEDLRRALKESELFLEYQPVLNLRTRKVVGVEALVRWAHPTRGRIPPNAFIHVAEETGLIHELTDIVLHDACRQASAWNAKGRSRLSVSLNVSAASLTKGRFVQQVADELEASGLAPDLLVLEVTEKVLLHDAAHIHRTLDSLKELGPRLAIDDFGTEYSAFSYLHRFPMDILKIDRGFMDHLRSRDGRDEIVATIVRLGKKLGLKTIAEGIEDYVQCRALVRMGCTFGQGFYFSAPISAEDVDALLEEQVDSAAE